MKKYLRKISAILSIILITPLISSISYADTKESPVLFNDLPSDTVIMYIGDKEVTIGDLDSDNSIVIDDEQYFFTPNEKLDDSLICDNNEEITNIKNLTLDNENNKNSGITTYVTKPGHEGSGSQALQILPSGKTNALVQRKLKTNRYSQQSDTYYLNSKKGTEFAYKLVSGSTLSIIANGCISIAIGSTKAYVGALYAAASMFSALKNKAIGDKILSYTSKGQKVRITTCKSPYGTFKSVSRWSSNAIEITCTNNSTTSEYIYNKVFH